MHVNEQVQKMLLSTSNQPMMFAYFNIFLAECRINKIARWCVSLRLRLTPPPLEGLESDSFFFILTWCEWVTSRHVCSKCFSWEQASKYDAIYLCFRWKCCLWKFVWDSLNQKNRFKRYFKCRKFIEQVSQRYRHLFHSPHQAEFPHHTRQVQKYLTDTVYAC